MGDEEPLSSLTHPLPPANIQPPPLLLSLLAPQRVEVRGGGARGENTNAQNPGYLFFRPASAGEKSVSDKQDLPPSVAAPPVRPRFLLSWGKALNGKGGRERGNRDKLLHPLPGITQRAQPRPPPYSLPPSPPKPSSYPFLSARKIYQVPMNTDGYPALPMS